MVLFGVVQLLLGHLGVVENYDIVSITHGHRSTDRPGLKAVIKAGALVREAARSLFDLLSLQDRCSFSWAEARV